MVKILLERTLMKNSIDFSRIRNSRLQRRERSKRDTVQGKGAYFYGNIEAVIVLLGVVN